MGAFYVDCEVESLDRPGEKVRIKKLLVDTGSEYTWIPENELKKVSILPRKKDISFIMANGKVVTRDVGYAVIYVDEFETVDEVVFAKLGDLNLLGARTLEGFPAVVNPMEKKIVATGPLPAAGNGQ